MDKTTRRQLAEQALSGYASGPAATTEATARALARVDDARVVVLVEGISDQIALQTLASRQGRRLDAEAVVILPIGGAHAITGFLLVFGPEGAGLRLAGLCDAAEEELFARGLRQAGLGSPETRADMSDLGFHVCVEDLEDELIRAVGPARVEAVLDSQGDLGSFRTLQKQPAWRMEGDHAQLRRFLSAGAKRKLRYARLLVEAADLDHVPPPLEGALSAI